MTLSVGDLFAGYRIIRLLGVGGMGEVYLAQHPRLPRQDALKLLRTEVCTDPVFRTRFIREADSVAALDHPNIVKVYDRGENGEQLWIATQYIDGTDAAEQLRQHYPAGMPTADAIAIIVAVADALDYAHGRGLVHRDVKPANVLLARPGPEGIQRTYLADFGIARPLADPQGLTATSMAVGTVEYAAPEQLLGQSVDGRADQYALAATAYRLLTGSPVFPATNPIVAINDHINSTPPTLARSRPDLAALDPVLATALAKDPADRYRSCGDFARALKTAAIGGSPAPEQPATHAPTLAAPIAPPPPQTPPPVERGPKAAGSKTVWVAVAAMALALAAIVAVMTQRHSPMNSAAPSSTAALPAAPSPTAAAPPTTAPTVTKTAVETMTRTVMPLPGTAPVARGVIVGSCGGAPEPGFHAGTCGIVQRSGPYTEAPRLVPEALQDGAQIGIVCFVEGDVRESDSGVSSSWYRLTNGAYVPVVYVSTTDTISPC